MPLTWLVGADARHLSGNGALVTKAPERVSQRKTVNVGKPQYSVTLADLVHRQHELDSSRTVMVRDRLDTDIRFGVEGGRYAVGSCVDWTRYFQRPDCSE